MKLTRWIVIALALGLMTACGAEESEATEETPAAETPPAAEAPAEETAAAEEAEEAPAADEAAAEGEAPAAAEGEGTPCEQAFASIQALRAQLEAHSNGQNEAPPLDRDGYLERCNALPAGAQSCMILGYAAEHGEECAQFQAQIQAANSQ